MLDRDKLLVRRSAIQRRVRPGAVVEKLILVELERDAGGDERFVIAVPELDPCGSVGMLDAAGRSQHGEHPWLSLRGSIGVCSPFA